MADSRNSLKAIVVIWMDQVIETYPDVEATLRDNVLHLYQYTQGTRILRAEWHHPVFNIRTWHPEGQETP